MRSYTVILAALAILALTACSQTPPPQQKVDCSGAKPYIDAAMRAYMIKSGYAFRGGC